MNNIDWDFISKLEGNKLRGYVPDADGSKSGVTIASGFDLGARSLSDLSGLPDTIIQKLKPFLGYKGAEAAKLAGGLKVSKTEANTINEFAKTKASENLASAWKQATGEDFSTLDRGKATAVASVAFQYGNLPTETPRFWRAVTSNNWSGAIKELRDFKDRYPSRRNKEADYLVANVDLGTDVGKFDDLSNVELVELVQDKIKKSRQLRSEDEPEVQTVTAEPVIEDITEPVPVEPENIDIAQATPKRENLFGSEFQLPSDRRKLPQEEIEALIQQDIENSGPVSETIKKHQFGEAGMIMFTDDQSQIWSAAMRNLNPVLGLRDGIMQTINAPDEDPSYDPFQDPQLRDYSKSMWRFYDSRSQEETARRIDRLNSELANQQLLDSSASGFQQFVSSVASPTTLAPVATPNMMRAATGLGRFYKGAGFSSAVVGAEQSALLASRETYSPSTAVLATAAAGLIGGGINARFGNRIMSSVDAKAMAREEALNEQDGFYRSAGAAASPERQREIAYQFIDDEATRETGIGIEKLPANPVLRMLQSKNPIVRGLTASMVDMGGIIQKKVEKELAMEQSVETIFNSKYIGGLVDSLRQVDKDFLAYRGIVASEGDIRRSFQVIGVNAMDQVDRLNPFTGGLSSISEVAFRNRVGKAMRRGDRDAIDDMATPHVESAARRARQHFDFIAEEVVRSRLHIEAVERQLRAIRALGDEADPRQIAMLEARLEKVKREGLTTNTAESYLPRIYRVDRIMAEEGRFRAIVSNYAGRQLGLTGQANRDYVDSIFDSITKSKPFVGMEEGVDDLDSIIMPGSVRHREFEIPDELIEDFLESDIEVLLRYHTKQVGMDVELKKAFGSIDMRDVLKQVNDEWERLIASTNDPVQKSALRKQRDRDLTDIRGLRDRLRGTYGASRDPHALSSRFVRVAKSFNVIVGMGGATISSIPDMARTMMVEGFKTTYEHGIRNQFRANSARLKALNMKELRASGVAADALLGLRASAFADIGDIFGNRFAVERAIGQSVGVMFIINGLNIWNQFLKEFAGTVTSLRMNEAIMKNWNDLSKADKEKLLKNGIDQQSAERMQALIRRHGEVVDGNYMPNTELWEDAAMRQMYRSALNQNVNRIIVTPGAGDRALWTSTEFGSLLTQFKSFGQAATMRVLISGLQERDSSFWLGSFFLIALAGMVNEIKRIQYGIDKPESFDEKLVNAFERSGIGGYLMDVNNVVEKLSNYGVGMRPLLTDQRSYPVPMGAKLGAVAGPAGSNFVNVLDVAKDVLGGNVSQDTMDTLKFITPYSSLPGVGNALDAVYNIE